MELNVIKTAQAAFHSGNFQEAAHLFQTAIEQASQANDPLVVAEQKNNLSVALLQAGDPHGAFQAAEGTDLVFAEANDIKRQAMALGNKASAMEALGRLEDAVRTYQQASDLLKGINENEMRSYILKNMAAIQIRTGGELQALASMQAALDNQGKLSLRQKILKKLVDIPFKMWR